MARGVAVNMLAPLRGFILDMDGTVYLSDRALPGAVETIATLHGAGWVLCSFPTSR